MKIVSAGVLSGLKPAKEDGEGSNKQSDSKDGQFFFDLKPDELISYLDDYVVGQSAGKAALATKVCTHFNRVRHELERGYGQKHVGRIKSNILLMGPTGVGKTYLVKLIADRLGVPFVKGDATKFSETGFVGGDVDDLVRDLVRQADDDIAKAEYGIIYVDEIDKIAGSSDYRGADVSRAGVQRALLKPMEETTVEMKVPHDPLSQMEAIEHYRATGKREKKVVNTRNILFIMSGAFAALPEIVQKRTAAQSIGFGQNISNEKSASDLYRSVKAEDLIKFGFESEFVGRLPVMATLDALTFADFVEILASHTSSVVVGKKQDFNAYGIKLVFTPEAYDEIANLAVEEQTGARGLVAIMEKTLLPFETALPTSKIKVLAVTASMVHDHHGELAKLLADTEMQLEQTRLFSALYADEKKKLVTFANEKLGQYLEDEWIPVYPARLEMIATLSQDEIIDPRRVSILLVEYINHIKDFADTVADDCGLNISLTEAAIDRLLEKSTFTLTSVAKACEKLFKSLDYGLRLIANKYEGFELEITRAGVDEPEFFINGILDEQFKL